MTTKLANHWIPMHTGQGDVAAALGERPVAAEQLLAAAEQRQQIKLNPGAAASAGVDRCSAEGVSDAE